MPADQRMMACSNKDVKRESKTNMYTEVRVWYLKSNRKTIFYPQNSFFMELLKY